MQQEQQQHQDIVKKHKRILFNGDNYTEAWHKEAEKRGLPNLKTTLESLETLKEERVAALFEKHKVFSRTELHSRIEIYTEQYKTRVGVEANIAANMARTMIVPVALEYLSTVAGSIEDVSDAGCNPKMIKEILKDLCSLTEKTIEETCKLEKNIANGSTAKEKLDAMLALRAVVDELESKIPSNMWPLPSYADMLFL